MNHRIDFNPALCAMCDQDLNAAQRNLIMAFLPYLGAPLTGSNVSQQALKLVKAAFKSLQGPLGPWELLWGPGVMQVLPGAIPANTMFLARHRETG